MDSSLASLINSKNWICLEYDYYDIPTHYDKNMLVIDCKTNTFRLYFLPHRATAGFMVVGDADFSTPGKLILHYKCKKDSEVRQWPVYEPVYMDDKITYNYTIHPVSDPEMRKYGYTTEVHLDRSLSVYPGGFTDSDDSLIFYSSLDNCDLDCFDD